MTDELSIQQNQPSATPYILGGATVGGLGAGLGTHYYVKPKYGSYEDIIKEAEDTTSFQSKIDSAEGDKKKFLEEAKEVGDARKTAEATWQQELDAYKAENGKGELIETEDFKKLKKAEAEAQTNYDKLLNEKINNMNSEVADKRTATIEEALSRKEKQLYDATKYFEKLKANGAEAEKIKAAESKVKTLEKEADELAKKISEMLKYNNGGDIVQQQKDVAKAIRQTITDNVTAKLQNYDKPAITTREANAVKEYLTKKEAFKNEEMAYNNAMKKVSELRGGVSVTDANFKNQLNIADNSEVNQLKRLENLKAALEVTERAEGGRIGFFAKINNLRNAIINMMNGKNPFVAVEKGAEDGLQKYLNTLSENERKVVEKLFDGEITKEKIDEAIKIAENRQKEIRTIGQKYNQWRNLDDLRRQANDALVELRNLVGDNGAYVKDGVLYGSKNKPIVTTPKPNSVQKVQLELPNGVTIPDDAKIEYNISNTQLSAEELKARAESALKETDEAKTLKTAKAAVEEARKGLKRGEALTDTQIEEAVAKKLNVENKEKYIENQVEKKANAFKEKFAKELENKLGKNAGWKLAGITAGGILLGSLIGKMFAPKSEA